MMPARQAAQTAEDARRRQADLDTRAATDAQAIAERDTLTADAARLTAERNSATADAARTAAEAGRLAADAQNQKAQSAVAQSEQDKDALRAQLRDQLNVILETRETSRGLIVNLSDVLFDSASSNLKSGAREKLALVSGILLSHPGLELAIEGHTDSIGSEVYNQGLSERRSESVRVYFAGQRVGPADVVTAGFGESQPVASNASAAGRQYRFRSSSKLAAALDGRTPFVTISLLSSFLPYSVALSSRSSRRAFHAYCELARQQCLCAPVTRLTMAARFTKVHAVDIQACIEPRGVPLEHAVA